MSFKNDYKNQMDNIQTDGYIRKKVLNEIEKREQANKRTAFPFLKIAAAVVCLAIAVGLAFPLSKHFVNIEIGAKEDINLSSDSGKVTDYSQIYSKVKEVKKLNYKYYSTDDMVDMETAVEGGTNGSSTALGVITDTADGATTKGSSAENTTANKSDDYSETNTQVEGVDEADIVKTDGEYIYSLSAKNRKIRIIKAGKEPKLISTIALASVNYYSQNMYLYEDYLVVFTTEYDDTAKVIVYVYDVSNPENPEKINQIEQDGNYTDSRLIGDKLYLISEYSVNVDRINGDEPKTYVPTVYCGDYNGAVPADSVYINEVCNYLSYTVICGYDITKGELIGTQSLLGGTYAVYCSTENIIIAGYSADSETEIARFSIDDGKIELKAQGKLKGGLLNQFSIDEYNGYFRFVTTTSTVIESRTEKVVSARIETANALYVFDGDLKQVGKIENLAPDERVYSVRFMGDTAYFVTFRQVDPLFSADLSDPYNPKIIGSLKIPGFSSYLHPYGEGLLLGIGQDADEKTGKTGNVKLSMFDISNPENVSENAKTIMDNVYYSDALDNHKAALIDESRNIIGFSCYKENGRKYLIYAFENDEFTLKAEIDVADLKANTRGLFIGNELYIVSDESLLVYSLGDYQFIYELEY